MLRSMCAKIRRQCRDLSSLASLRKDIEAADLVYRQVSASGGRDADKASDEMEELALHLWRTAVNQIESAYSVKRNWNAFKAAAGWLVPVIERIYG